MDFFLPGMIHVDGKCGKYPAISITGRHCSLGCLHCKGSLLENMLVCDTPDKLKNKLLELENEGMKGALISGGCDEDGRLPWDQFLPILTNLETSLFLSAHAGLNVDANTAKALKASVLRQVLIDVTVDDDTISEVYRVKNPRVVLQTIENLYKYGPQVVPHVIVGIYKGQIKGEYEALDLLSKYSDSFVILVVLMPINKEFSPPPLDDVLNVFRYARKRFKKLGLGCARPRGVYRHKLEEALINEGLIDRLAVWSDKTISQVEGIGEKINYHYTCCSLMADDL